MFATPKAGRNYFGVEWITDPAELAAIDKKFRALTSPTGAKATRAAKSEDVPQF